MRKLTWLTKNANTGNKIRVEEIFEVGDSEPVFKYVEIIEIGLSSVYCSGDDTGGYFAFLEEGIDIIASVRNQPSIDAALSSLEATLNKKVADGDSRPILGMWRCPQTLEL